MTSLGDIFSLNILSDYFTKSCFLKLHHQVLFNIVFTYFLFCSNIEKTIVLNKTLKEFLIKNMLNTRYLK